MKTFEKIELAIITVLGLAVIALIASNVLRLGPHSDLIKLLAGF